MKEEKISKVKYFTLGIITCTLIFGTTVYAATVLSGSDVSYSNTSSGLTSTNVQGAIDELYTKTNTLIDSSNIDFGSLATNSAKTVLASSKGVCIKRNNKLNCFKPSNNDVEKEHLKQVFSDVSCDVSSSRVFCRASDFYCSVYSDGSVGCSDNSDDSFCNVSSDGSVRCN